MPLPLNVPKPGLSLDEAAEYAGVSRNTLTRYGPPPTKIGNSKSMIAEFSTQVALSTGRGSQRRVRSPRLPIGLQ
jgi:hypothetical protein